MNNSSPSISVTMLKGVGPKVADLLVQLDILTVSDLLFHLPLRYEDRTKIKSIGALQPGDRALVEGCVQDIKIVGARRYLRCVIADDAGATLQLVFFHFLSGHQKKLANASGRLRCFGEVRRSYSGGLEIVHPEYAIVNQIRSDSLLAPTKRLSPVYPTTKGVQQVMLRKLMQQALQLMHQGHCLRELLPDNLLKSHDFWMLHDALQFVHFPPADVNQAQLISGQHPAQKRLVFEELMAHQLTLQHMRHRVRTCAATALSLSNHLANQLKQSLPFSLTNAQTRVLSEIESDLSRDIPMLRLVQGDVGSGKTIVACFAALNAIEAGAQVAIMAPTEILVEQHYQSFSDWLSPMDIVVDHLTGRQNSTEQQIVKTRLESGECQLIVGTHALFQKEVRFKNLVLLVIDEQHRFGVHQRLALMEKGIQAGRYPHQLIMTATPIPRTLAMSAYADLDFSTIDELPPGRKPINTVLISSVRRDHVIDRVRVNCQEKRQAYWICTLIDESEVLQCEAAEKTATYLQEKLPDLHVGLVHGRLKSPDKKAVMTAFQQGEIDLLVATTVVEVGVDIANASLMIIENPERLGLAQLHQLRGRIGRGCDASFCVLLYQDPLSETAKKRLAVMRETQDGFEISRQDLAMRGPGEVLGTRQSGLMQLRVADLMRDKDLLPIVHDASQLIVKQHPNSALLLMERWVGSQAKYMNA